MSHGDVSFTHRKLNMLSYIVIKIDHILDLFNIHMHRLIIYSSYISSSTDRSYSRLHRHHLDRSYSHLHRHCPDRSYSHLHTHHPDRSYSCLYRQHPDRSYSLSSVCPKFISNK